MRSTVQEMNRIRVNRLLDLREVTVFAVIGQMTMMTRTKTMIGAKGGRHNQIRKNRTKLCNRHLHGLKLRRVMLA